MRTFDWALFELYNDGHISYEEALRNADSANELRLAMKLKSKRGEPAGADGPVLSFDKEPTAEELEAIRSEEQRKQAERKRQLENEELERKMKEKGLDSRFTDSKLS
jgi:twitching motility protein PilU